jgi:hypothetical protein
MHKELPKSVKGYGPCGYKSPKLRLHRLKSGQRDSSSDASPACTSLKLAIFTAFFSYRVEVSPAGLIILLTLRSMNRQLNLNMP